VDDIATQLKEISAIEAELAACMQFITESREAYIQAHPQDFTERREHQKYVSAWAANYEISDYLSQQAQQGQMDRPVYFLRYNQWPERNIATHEEAKRLVEEQRETM